MDLFAHLGLGFSTALSPVNLLYCFVGCLLGTVVGVLPGIGPLTTIALLLPITFNLSPIPSLIMLAGIYYGAQYGGSTTAILINLPGENSSAVTAIDGYQMARRGRAGVALATAAIGSFVAGSFATLVIAVFALPMTAIALSFGPPEYFSLIVLGLISSIALAHGSIVKAIAMTLLGILFGVIGTDIYTGTPRFTMGIPEFFDGLDFVPIAVGMFGVAEILKNLEQRQSAMVSLAKVTSLLPNREDFRRMFGPIVRGTLLGSVLGVLPGGGALLSSFASYTVEKRISRRPEEFGHGAIEGVAGPESANNAGAQTSFIPMLTLGIPSNALMALMVGALTIQGVQPGPDVAVKRPDLFWGVIASMWIGNAMLVILNLPLVGIWVKLLKVPYKWLVPTIVLFSAVGVYSVAANAFLVGLISFFGALGYLMAKLDCEPAPLLLGLILGPMLEEHLRRTLIISRGDPSVFITHPISAGLLAVALLALILAFLPALAKKREEVFTETA